MAKKREVESHAKGGRRKRERVEFLESNRNLPPLLLTRLTPLYSAGVLLWRIPCNGRKFGNLTLPSGSAWFLHEHFGVSPPDTILLLNEIVLPYNHVVAPLHLPDLHRQLVQFPPLELAVSLFSRVSFGHS